MGITILAGGCRQTTDAGDIQDKQCNECVSKELCALEPQARRLAELSAELWTRTDDLAPPEDAAILYLEYPSETPSGSVHLGYYDGDCDCYVEFGSGDMLPVAGVIAWMAVPGVPDAVYAGHRPTRRRLYGRQPQVRLSID